MRLQVPKRALRPKLKELEAQYRLHCKAAELAKLEPGNTAIWQWHGKQAAEVHQQLLDRYAELEHRQPSEEVQRARNSRWRHYGALGSARWAVGGIRGIYDMPTATAETKELAYQITQLLYKLIDSLNTRKDQK